MKTFLSLALLLTLARQTSAGSSIQGRVLNPDDTAAAGMIVELLQQGFSNEGVRRWHPVAEGRTTTDERGQFRVSSLRPGTYYLRVISKPVTSGTTVAWTPTTYLPGVLNGALASAVVIRSGQDASVTLTIPQGNPYTVSGKVVNSLPGESSLLPVRLILMRRDFGAPIETTPGSLETMNLATGSANFELRGVPSGSYELFAVARMQNTGTPSGPNPTWLARATFDISDQDIDNLSLALRPGADVKGKLTVVGDASGVHLFEARREIGAESPAGTRVNLSLAASDGSPVEFIRPPKIDGDTFTFDNIPEGTYSISVSVGGARQSAYVADIRSGARSIFGERVVVGNAPPEPIEIIVNTNGGSVPINVAGRTGLPATILLVPAAPLQKNANRYRYVTVTDPSGNLTITNVAPGDYTVYAWEHPLGLTLPHTDPNFIARHATRGVSVHVTAGETALIQVQVVRIEQLD